MLPFGITTALQVVKTYGANPVEICKDLEIDVHLRPFEHLKGVMMTDEKGTYIGIAEHLDSLERTYTLAHELGHYFMHPHEIGYFWIHKNTCYPVSKIEKQADDFALTLVLLHLDLFFSHIEDRSDEEVARMVDYLKNMGGISYA